MITLNLVSDDLKKEIKLRHLYALIKKINCVLAIITVLTAIVLLTARIILQNNFNKVVEQTTLLSKNSQGYNNTVRTINTKMNSIDKIQTEFIPWSKVMADLAQLTPAGITFYYVGIKTDDQSIKIKGQAKFRDDLLQLKKGLENSSYYNSIDFPLKNILEKQDIDFEISAKMDIKKLSEL